MLVTTKEFGVQLSKNPFYQSDLDLNPMILILKTDIDIVNMSHNTKNEVSMSRHSKVIQPEWTHRYADSMKTLFLRIHG